MTIRTRLTLWYSSLLATLIFVFGISLFSLLSWAWRSQILENMAYIANQTLPNLSADSANGHLTATIPETLEQITYYPFGIQIWQADRQLVAASTFLGHYNKPFDAEMLGSADSVSRDVYLEPDNAHALVL